MDILKQNIRLIKGVGEKIENYFHHEKIYTYEDLLNFFPKKYTFYEVKDINNIVVDTKITTQGIISSQLISRKFRRSIDNLIFSMNIFGKNIKIIIFGQPFLKYNLKVGMKVTIHGLYKPKLNEIIVNNIFTENFDAKIDVDYKLDGISNLQMQRFVERALLNVSKESIIDDLPVDLQIKYRLLNKADLILKAHFPKNLKDLHEIARRLKYEEFLNYALSLESLKQQKEKVIKNPKNFSNLKISDYMNSLPYKLTDDQNITINTILDELKSNKVMNRLVQGDVGSGKTIVALISAYATILAGNQVVMMVPTEILAGQMYNYFINELNKYEVQISLLTSSIKKSIKDDTLERVRHGRVNILIGTHALLEENVKFQKLGLVIIDEQHRFGVEERTKLVNKCSNTDALFLTATPIPRTLGLTNFGDLDISSIKSMPVGRKTIITKVINEFDLDDLYEKMNERLENNEQIYVIVPLVNESDKINAFDINTAYELFSKEVKNSQIGILHGKLKSDEKDNIMNDFKNKKYNILISTTVVEVGVDVKNATMIVILNAERFGLSQLHQLRGRVGRNSLQSYCYLVSNSLESERLRILERCSDGFTLSNEDFLLRGPGDYLGERQSGFDRFDFADFSKDENIWKVAVSDAVYLFEEYNNNNKKYTIVEKITSKISTKTNKLN